MARDGQEEAVLETSVLVNFLAVDRVDLLAAHPSYRFIITDHVRGEITAHYAEQLERLEKALSTSLLSVRSVDSLDPTFVTLVKDGRLGVGECAAIALAVNGGLALAIDDKRATKAAENVSPGLRLEGTETLVVSLIKAQVLDVATADAIKMEWETKFRFKLMFGSFAEKV
jgi:predicted nucleic acid-binding protein